MLKVSNSVIVAFLKNKQTKQELMNVHGNFLTWHRKQPEKAIRREQMDTNLGEDNF